MTLPDQIKLVCLVKEWRDAREAVFREPLKNTEGWVKLGDAEYNLMDFARSKLPE